MVDALSCAINEWQEATPSQRKEIVVDILKENTAKIFSTCRHRKVAYSTATQFNSGSGFIFLVLIMQHHCTLQPKSTYL